MISDTIRDAPLGQLVRWATKNKYFQYPEERADFKLPEAWAHLMNNPDLPFEDLPEGQSAPARESHSRSSSTVAGDEESKPQATHERPQTSDAEKERDPEKETPPEASSANAHPQQDLLRQETAADGGPPTIEKTKSVPITPKRTRDGAILVDWYFTDDSENPHNWGNWKRFSTAIIICLYTFVVYTSSAIYTSSTQGIMDHFHVSTVKATLGLSIYVLGYGIGPLIFSPLSEIPRIGRNPVYIVTFFLFVILSIPTSLVNSYSGLMALRFFTGFFGSPCLASGGASLGDLYSLMSLPYAMMAWVSAAYCGPALGPLLSGFAVPVKGWRWSLYISTWASAPILIAMFFLLPETSSPNILLRRAQRLRKLTGNDRFKSQSEIDMKNMTVGATTLDALVKPLEITIKDPAVLFVQIYTAIIYGIYYSFFEVFPLVYTPYYGFNLGEIGIVFICILVSCILAVIGYVAYLHYGLMPRIMKRGLGAQEEWLIPALPLSVGPTVGLFLFAWTARASIHWIAPTIGITIYGGCVFVVMQCIFMYIPLSYPQYAASLFAANDFFRSAFACGSVLFAHPLFGNLGVAKGTSLLGGLSVLGIIGIWVLYFYGARLRSRSKFAMSSTETF